MAEQDLNRKASLHGKELAQVSTSVVDSNGKRMLVGKGGE